MNTARPYWEDHERVDVVEARRLFVQRFLSNKDNYYLVSEGEDLQWLAPKSKPTILLCMHLIRLQFSLLTFVISCLVHEESCFRSGETAAKRWIFSEGTKPFFNKGRGKLVMISEFLVSHPDNHFFKLSHEEWKAAVSRYPKLMEETDIDYIDRSALGSIQVGYDRYFDNNAIVSQFTHLFKMLPFKIAYANHSIHVVVDNARTYSAKEFSLDEFGMKPGTRCPVDHIQYIDDHGQQKNNSILFYKRSIKRKI